MKQKILFVDDQTKVLMGLERMLHDQRDKWDMTFISSSLEALKWIAQESCDVAVLDVKMPGKNGIELLTDIKSDFHTKNTEVIMLTGLQDQKFKRIALNIGASDLLNKPVLKEDLIARLNNVLKLKSYHDELQERNYILEQQLIQSQRMEVMGVLAAGVVHDLKNILTIIRGYPDLINLKLVKNLPVHKELTRIKDAADRAHNIMIQLLKLTKSRKVSFELCNIVSIISDSIELFKPLMTVDITVEWTQPEKEYIINADETQMSQVLMNLLINAKQAMKQGGKLKIQINETEIEPGSELIGSEICLGKYLKLEVSDTGKGMDQEIQNHMFEPLYTTRESVGGSGLGLFVVSKIIKNHKGFITVESKQGEGTTFFVYLPCFLEKNPQN